MFNNFSLKVVLFVTKCGTARQITDDIIWRMGFACWVTEATYTHSYILLFHGISSSERTCLILRLYVQCLSSCSLAGKHFSPFEWLPVALCYEPTGWSVVYFQVKFLDTFRHSMQANVGKIRQNKA